MEGKQDRKEALAELVAFVQRYADRHPGSPKGAVASAVAKQFGLRLDRSIYVGEQFAVRWSKASGHSFPGTVLSLSTLSKYDHLPVVVCVVRPTGVQLLLANSTLIDKVSHTSQRLAIDKIRGSFNGTNILRSFDGLPNDPRNFDALFARHLEVGFEENYSRIVENTLAIRGRGARFAPTSDERAAILAAPELATVLSHRQAYIDLRRKLAQTVEQHRDEILSAAISENVNLRGNAIEQIVTRAGNLHGVQDLVETLASGVTIHIDIKTKLIGRISNPKAYNVDKLLRLLAAGNAAFSFLFIGVDLPARKVSSQLVSFLDKTILRATRIQIHWAGRNSRGVTQLTGDLSRLFSPTFRESIDVVSGRAFLQRLIEI